MWSKEGKFNVKSVKQIQKGEQHINRLNFVLIPRTSNAEYTEIQHTQKPSWSRNPFSAFEGLISKSDRGSTAGWTLV